MPKTRQQRIAEKRAGHVPSPPQVLTDKPRGPRRTWAKTPSAHSIAAEVPGVSSQPLAAPGPEPPRALVHVWVDENRYVYDPSHAFSIPSALVPELVHFLNKLRDHGTQNLIASSSSFGTQVTPSLNRRQFSPGPPTSRAEPHLPEPSAPMKPQPASTGVKSPFQETPPPIDPHAPSAHIEQPFRQLPEATTRLSTPAHVRSPPQETYRSMTLHDYRPARVEAPLEKTAYPIQTACVDQPVNIISPRTTPTNAAQQTVSTSGHREIIHKQTLNQKMPDQEVREFAKSKQTKPMRKSVSSMKGLSGASGVGRGKKRAMSGNLPTPAPTKRKLSPVPSDPEMLRALGLPSIFRKYRNLPAYTVDGLALYGGVEPSDDYLKFQDEPPANINSNIAGSTPQTPQAISSSIHGRVIRPTRSVKRQFGFSPLTPISERSETTPPVEPAKRQQPMRFPSRLLDRMNANKRKRWTSPESIPNPKGKSYGLGEMEFYGNAKENEDEIVRQQPGKVRRTSHLKNFSSQGAVSSRQCTGPQSINSKTPIKITNAAGSFKVPSPSDTDWSDSQSEDEGPSQAVTAPSSTINNSGPTSRPQFRANAYKDWLQSASPAAAAVVERIEVNPTAAGQKFGAALDSSSPPTSRPQFTAFEDWLQTASPSVVSALERMDVDSNVAGAAFHCGLVNHTTN